MRNTATLEVTIETVDHSNGIMETKRISKLVCRDHARGNIVESHVVNTTKHCEVCVAIDGRSNREGLHEIADMPGEDTYGVTS